MNGGPLRSSASQARPWPSAEGRYARVGADVNFEHQGVFLLVEALVEARRAEAQIERLPIALALEFDGVATLDVKRGLRAHGRAVFERGDAVCERGARHERSLGRIRLLVNTPCPTVQAALSRKALSWLRGTCGGAASETCERGGWSVPPGDWRPETIGMKPPSCTATLTKSPRTSFLNALALDAFCRRRRRDPARPPTRNRRHRIARRDRARRHAANVTVLKREDFDVENPAKLADVLRRVAGVHVDPVGGRGGTGSLYLRGADPNYTLVLVDGVRVNDPTNARGGSFDFSALDIAEVGTRRSRARAVFGRVRRRCAGRRHQHRDAACGRERRARSVDAMGGAYDTREVSVNAGGPMADGNWNLGVSDSNEGELVRGNRISKRSASPAASIRRSARRPR